MTDIKRKPRVYEGERISVQYDSAVCMHAAECVRSGLTQVFNKQARPWVNADGSSPERIIDVIERCPSGALTYTFVQPEVAETNRVQPQPDGALFVRGDVSIMQPDGEVMTTGTRFALCRCGHSRNKPFCDYSHHDAGFKDDGTLAQNQLLPDVINTETPLRITLDEDGPLLVQGAFAVRSANNADIVYGEHAALCRCGASKQKPFCDGSHKTVGFKS